jgi:hypothetical protein
MTKISLFTDFLGESESTLSPLDWGFIGEDAGDELNDAIRQIIFSDDFKKYVGEFLSERSLEIDEINDDYDLNWDRNFSITYQSSRMDGSIPNRITIYMDELCKKMGSDWFGVEIDWWFGKNGNCNLVNFNIESDPDIKWLKSRKLLKYI